jgi:hypothetical protein
MLSDKLQNSLSLLGAMALCLSIATSCSKGEESPLQVVFPGGATYALPTTATSCAATQAGDIEKDNFSYRNVTLTWTHETDSVYVLAIKLEFKSPQLTYSCIITGDELGMVFATGGTSWNGNLYHKTSPTDTDHLSVTNTCAVKCGGVTVPPNTPTTTALGTVTVIGIQRNAAGDEKPVKGTTQVKLNFGGL